MCCCAIIKNYTDYPRQGLSYKNTKDKCLYCVNTSNRMMFCWSMCCCIFITCLLRRCWELRTTACSSWSAKEILSVGFCRVWRGFVLDKTKIYFQFQSWHQPKMFNKVVSFLVGLSSILNFFVHSIHAEAFRLLTHGMQSIFNNNYLGLRDDKETYYESSTFRGKWRSTLRG